MDKPTTYQNFAGYYTTPSIYYVFAYTGLTVAALPIPIPIVAKPWISVGNNQSGLFTTPHLIRTVSEGLF